MRLAIDIACIVFLAFLVTASIAFAINPTRKAQCEREVTDWCSAQTSSAAGSDTRIHTPTGGFR